jgi:tetratricopeptide (TPR) repeat protein
MILRSLTLACFLFSALSPCIARASQEQSNSGTTPVPNAAATAPTLAEMRQMTAEELDVEGDRMRIHKDYLSALDCYRAAVHKHPLALYYNKIAITEIMQHHPAEAEKAARKALHKNKHMAEAWNNLAVTYYMREKYDDAVRLYQRAISIEPNFAAFHNNLAAAYIDSKQLDRSVAEYRAAFELDPAFFEKSAENGVSARMGSPQDSAQFAFIMARLFAGNGDLDRALHFLRRAMEDGYPQIDEVYHDKEFARALGDERFVSLLKDRPVAVQ